MVRLPECGRVLPAGLLLFAACVSSSGLLAQMPIAQQPADASAPYVPTLNFDVASIRESVPSESFTVGFDNPDRNGLIRFTNVRVMDMLVMAYHVDYQRVLGAPPWVESTPFMVEAKCDSAVDDKLAHLTIRQAQLEKQHMIQALLADRFRLKARQETREGTVYNLVVAKGGPKMSTNLLPPTAEQKAWFHGSPVPPLYQSGCDQRGCQFIAHGATMQQLAAALAGQMDTRVFDKTGLTGKYDFVLEYLGTIEGPGDSDPEARLPLVKALPDQLGIKLEPVKGQMDVLVIDHIEKPSPN